MLSKRLLDQRPEEFVDEHPHVGGLRRALPDYDEPDDRCQPVVDLAEDLRLVNLGGESGHEGHHELLEAVPEGLVLPVVRHDRSHAVDDELVHSHGQRHRRRVEGGELGHEVLQVQFATVADLLEGNRSRLLHLLHTLQNVGGCANRRRGQEQGGNHLQCGPEKIWPRLHPLPQATQELYRCLLGVVQDHALLRVLVRSLLDERRQALDQLPEDTAVPDLRPCADSRQAEKVRLLHRDTLRLTLLQVLQDVLQGRVRREDLQAVLRQAEQLLPIGDEVIVGRERIIGRTHCAPPYHGVEQLHIDALELIDFRIGFRVPADLVCESVPELQWDRADLLTRQVCALENHLEYT
mmetsp:Transcript_120607/g.257571  ORF Transcript_120607/g.257571 Transcript_120607/m.257571 type:complete len:351 (-) Transcript_120607:1048-2100(-)